MICAVCGTVWALPHACPLPDEAAIGLTTTDHRQHQGSDAR